MFACCRASVKSSSGTPKKSKKGKQHQLEKPQNQDEDGDMQKQHENDEATTKDDKQSPTKEMIATTLATPTATTTTITTNDQVNTAAKQAEKQEENPALSSEEDAVEDGAVISMNGLRKDDEKELLMQGKDEVDQQQDKDENVNSSRTDENHHQQETKAIAPIQEEENEQNEEKENVKIAKKHDAVDDDDDDEEKNLVNQAELVTIKKSKITAVPPLANIQRTTTVVAAGNVPPSPAPKSCLSRHNSTHTSIKKKVNISNRAEIIEAPMDEDALMLPPLPILARGGMTSPSMLLRTGRSGASGDIADGDDADEDDVFSDSLPPPKRESMCAPYIGPDEMPEEAFASVAFTHGLPEWFSDERFSDIGCIEPPVTPVGRDELELRHQRMYAQLLRAAQAAVCFGSGPEPIFSYEDAAAAAGPSSNGAKGRMKATIMTSGGGVLGDCDPDLKPSVAETLEHLVSRLERLVERLERSISARDLELANRTLGDIVVEAKKRDSIVNLEQPPVVEDSNEQPLCLRIERVETSLVRLNDRHSRSTGSSNSNNNSSSHSQLLPEPPSSLPPPLTKEESIVAAGSLEDIPTVVDEYRDHESEEQEESLPPPPLSPSLPPTPPPPLPLPPISSSMSVAGYQDIMAGPLAQYLTLSSKIGGDVAKHAAFVKAAFDAQLQYVTLATQISQPGRDKQTELLQPTSAQISAIQDYREKNRASPFFNHLSAISESIPALGWVCVSPTPGSHVKEMNDAGQFYTNRVLKEWKEKDVTHVEWARSWIQTLTELQAFIKQYHTTGLVWSGKGGPPPPPPIGACPPPPPPPAFDLAAMALDDDGNDERSALFAQINQGENITKNLKKVTSDMQTHKNPTLRSGPAPFKTPAGANSTIGAASAVAKEPVFTRDGKKWLIEYQKNNASLVVDGAEMNNVVYVFRCEGSTLTVKGKVNNIVLDSCKKCSLLFDSVVASVEFVNCQSVQMQVLGFVPTISIDKTDGCQMYLSKDSLGVEIVNSKSSEMNVLLPEASGDFTELALPEQYKTTIAGKSLKTVCVDSLG